MAFAQQVAHTRRVVFIHLATVGLDEDFGGGRCTHVLALNVFIKRYYTCVTAKWAGATPLEFWQKW